jgi:signal peptidase II
MRLARERRLELAIVLVVVGLDQLTKALVRNALALHESVEVVPGLLDLTRVHNTGAAFGMLNGVDFAFKPVVMSLVALAALAGVAWYAIGVPLNDVIARIGIAGVVGGAIGNLIDRAASATCWISSMPTGEGGTSGRSMSPMPPSPWA